jgi:hypothetical protein
MAAKQELRPCPFDKEPCPGTMSGCAAWGKWKARQGWYDTEGCTHFKLTLLDMIPVEEEKKKGAK